jgi:hypothetical protein
LDSHCKETYGPTKQQGSETETPSCLPQTQKGSGEEQEKGDSLIAAAQLQLSATNHLP